ncbi:O-sialoglycoprotein endopeptidase [Perkinsela sp. CCAP 1560/4]|nr:O-sialoglycoprotein endopeptidase [Perkinsela sp. CCAP 1560/4]|eukprot:KNH04790.1 O-sialoglycoprotein endopeptidase [Perkinsela sp. CCAP 1560/4]
MTLKNPEILVLGIEGSANKIAVGIVGYDGTIYANIRKTHFAEAGKGFIPRETQKHHAFHVVPLIQRAIIHAFLTIVPQPPGTTEETTTETQKKEAVLAIIPRIACLCYTKGPGMAGCLGVGATVVRVLAQLWGRNSLALRKHHEDALLCRWKTSLSGSETDSPRWQGFKHPHAFSSVFVSQRYLTLPIIGVNHCVAHIEMGRLACGIQPPRGVHISGYGENTVADSSHSVVVLYVSGGNTQVITYNAHQYQIIGETIDIAVGNCIDRLARILGVSNDPCAGVNIERLARVARKRWEDARSGEKENTPKIQSNFIPLPYIVKGMDLSFSGLLSYCGEVLKHECFDGHIDQTDSTSELVTEAFLKQPGSKPKAKIEIHERFDMYDLCWSVEEHIFAALVEVTERALCLSGAAHVLIVGGVGCNLRLQEMMKSMTAQRNAHLADSFILGSRIADDATKQTYASHDMDERYCIDNGCMIAYTGALEHLAYVRSQATLGAEGKEDAGARICDLLEKVNVCQRYRTDDVCVTWYAE